MMHNDELQHSYRLPCIVRAVALKGLQRRWHVARMEEKSNAYRNLVRKPIRKRGL